MNVVIAILMTADLLVLGAIGPGILRLILA